MYICSSVTPSCTAERSQTHFPRRTHPTQTPTQIQKIYPQTHKDIHIQDNRMPPCIEKARAIMRVLTEDMWNHKAKHERTRLWRMYCSPQIKAYTPDGGESTGYEEVRLARSCLSEAILSSLPSHSRIARS